MYTQKGIRVEICWESTYVYWNGLSALSIYGLVVRYYEIYEAILREQRDPRETCSAVTNKSLKRSLKSKPPKGSRILGSKNQLGVLIFLVWQASRGCHQQLPFWRKLWDLRCHQPWRKYFHQSFMKVPLKKKGLCSKRKSFSDHFSFAGDMLVFMGVRYSNMACHKGQWWWVNLDDAFN